MVYPCYGIPPSNKKRNILPIYGITWINFFLKNVMLDEKKSHMTVQIEWFHLDEFLRIKKKLTYGGKNQSDGFLWKWGVGVGSDLERSMRELPG